MTKAKNPPAQTPARSSKRNISVDASNNSDLTCIASGPVKLMNRVKTRSMTRKADASLTYGASVQTGAIKKARSKAKENWCRSMLHEMRTMSAWWHKVFCLLNCGAPSAVNDQAKLNHTAQLQYYSVIELQYLCMQKLHPIGTILKYLHVQIVSP